MSRPMPRPAPVTTRTLSLRQLETVIALLPPAYPAHASPSYARTPSPSGPFDKRSGGSGGGLGDETPSAPANARHGPSPCPLPKGEVLHLPSLPSPPLPPLLTPPPPPP